MPVAPQPQVNSQFALQFVMPFGRDLRVQRAHFVRVPAQLHAGMAGRIERRRLPSLTLREKQWRYSQAAQGVIFETVPSEKAPPTRVVP
jgi:hypothetical protein